MRLVWYNATIYLYDPSSKTRIPLLDNFMGYSRQHLYSIFQHLKTTPKRKRLEYIIPYWFFVA